MKTESLLGIALELIEIVAPPEGRPADARVGRFFRARRYLGSRDRRVVGGIVWTWLRLERSARARWRRLVERLAVPGAPALPGEEELARLEFVHGQPPDPEREDDEAAERSRRGERLRLVYWLDLLVLARDDRLDLPFERFAAASTALRPADEDPGGPAAKLRSRALAPDVLEALDADRNAAPPADPAGRVALDCSLPEWIARRMVDRDGEETARGLGLALLEPASVDLRVGTRHRTREAVRERLESELRREVAFTPYSPLGLRLDGRCNLAPTTPSREGWIEVQDEGSQIVVLALDLAVGQTVIDACAGAGGKSLALADRVVAPADTTGDAPRGAVWACEIARDRLVELGRRAREGGLQDAIHMVPIYPAGDLPPALPAADRVLIDAPCTGLGTLRRNPELKRRFDEADAAQFAEEQLAILERFAALVRPGGRLAYAVCSFLPEETDVVADAFEARHPEFRRRPSDWAREHLPPACSEDDRVRIDPVRTGTDAFFIAQWERAEGASPTGDTG